VTLNPGDILVSDRSAFGGGGGIIRVDPVTGTQTLVSAASSIEPSMQIKFGGIGDAEACRTLELFGTRVMPEFA
jgi:hypothetical protein